MITKPRPWGFKITVEYTFKVEEIHPEDDKPEAEVSDAVAVPEKKKRLPKRAASRKEPTKYAC